MSVLEIMDKHKFSDVQKIEFLIAMFKEKDSEKALIEKMDRLMKKAIVAPSREDILCYGKRFIKNGSMCFVFTPVKPGAMHDFSFVTFIVDPEEVSKKYFSGLSIIPVNFNHISENIIGKEANVFCSEDYSDKLIFSVSIKRKTPNIHCVPECVDFCVYSLKEGLPNG